MTPLDNPSPATDEDAPKIVLPDGRVAGWLSETDEGAPPSLIRVDDTWRAVDAVKAVRAGDSLLWVGDYHNGRQLLQAMQRRIQRRRVPRAATILDRWRQERAHQTEEATLLGRVVVALDEHDRLVLPRAPDVQEAVRWAWGPSEGTPRVVSLRTLIGALGAAGWTRAGLQVPGLDGTLQTRFGVFAPTRTAYLTLLDTLPDVRQRTVIDIGCGTGVIGFILLQRGAARVHGTDLDPRAVALATDNARSLGLADRFQAHLADLFPAEVSADWIVFNPPWVPEEPRTRLDRAVFDPSGRVLERFLARAPSHLLPDGRVHLLLSDLPERLGIRADGALASLFTRSGYEVVDRRSTLASHRRARDAEDPLHHARANEQVTLWTLRVSQP
jgi:SAM-dependent methyltransferase